MDIKSYHACDDFLVESVVRPNGYNMKHLHYHNSYELYFLEKGQHGYLLHDKFIQVYPQDVVLLKPNVLHKSQNPKSYNRTCIYFTEEFLQKYYTPQSLQYLLQCFEKDTISLDTDTFHRAKRFWELLKESPSGNKPDDTFLYLGCILDLLNKNIDSPPERLPILSMEKMNPILSFIGEHYADINHLEDVANHFYVSVPHLCRIFKLHTGITVVNYINHVRIQHARELLIHTQKNITEIAFECGFNSSVYFCKIFRAQMSCTPRDFRKKFLK